MNKFKKSQVLMLALLAALLIVAPFLSSSLRPTYLYFLFNLLIIALGAEAGLLSAAFSKPQEDKRHATSLITPKPEASIEFEPKVATPASTQNKRKVVEKSANHKIVCAAVNVDYKVKKCPSTPSLFFIGENEVSEDVAMVYEEEGEEFGGLSGQELYTKAETFISNFYRQLKMQREDSWKRIHGFYQKAY
ncbi:DUF761 domain-containing protein/DUF4408 domain-containing protein [Cephalotus follicularis]|uniref:DUF761 domain-containing protein/DUF4408 domain-containing protein n=1 Tax=Cephalotus follicularis TaxID=3775 RepID=A0A1Q3CP02_CEPFO|nr:DUF761 domain-containing protein/DUF4408 domain-containing protein [Cephalotus follicularis]